MDCEEQLLYLRGVAADYIAYSGESIAIDHADRLGILHATNVDLSSTNHIEQQIKRLDASPWTKWLRPCVVCTEGESGFVDIHFHPDELSQTFDWELVTERGKVISGQFQPSELEQYGDYVIDGVQYIGMKFRLPNIPCGYHQLQLRCKRHVSSTEVILCPEMCFQSDSTKRGEKSWGLTIQLYSLRSHRNWGMGDFADLNAILKSSSQAGADAICLNPLHALDLNHPENASPYSPSDRRFINPLYISPELEPEFDACEKITALVTSPNWQTKLSELRDEKWVDYEPVANAKFEVFDLMYQHFVEHDIAKNTERALEFSAFTLLHGQNLQNFCNFQIRNAPQTTRSAAIPQFFAYLQWLGESQLKGCQRYAIELGMRFGIIRDLAVGAIDNGNEVSSNRQVFCKNVSIGAPPDPLAPQGQNWGLTPMEPIALRNNNYKHFISLLRENMRHCGALRIDHVMGLMRLWWWPVDSSLGKGAYVYYQADEMLALLRLESQRQACQVIGEDLGIVPPEMRQMLTQSKIFTNVLMYFEKNKDDAEFTLPENYPPLALAMVANHDVPTLTAWWNVTDLDLRFSLNLIESEQELVDQKEERRVEKQRLLYWLSRQNQLPDSWSDNATTKQFDYALLKAILCCCAKVNSQILLLQLEDLELNSIPVNIPGTSKEYANWQRKLSTPIEDVFSIEPINDIIRAFDQCRKSDAPLELQNGCEV